MALQPVRDRVGLEAARPNRGVEIGSQYNATDTGRVFEWNGAAWLDVTDNDTPVFTSPVTITDANVVLSATTGTQIGTAAAQKLAFHGATPTDQPAFVADPAGGATIDAQARTAIGLILDILAEKGLMAAS